MRTVNQLPMETRVRVRQHFQKQYPFNLMDEWGDYMRPRRKGISARGWALISLGLAFALTVAYRLGH
jgi:hypothetical protein